MAKPSHVVEGSVDQYDIQKKTKLVQKSIELYSVENLAFLWAVLRYRAANEGRNIGLLPLKIMQKILPMSNMAQNNMGDWIVEKFVVPKCPYEVNVSGRVRKKLIATHNQPADFDKAYEEIVSLINRDIELSSVCLHW